MNIRRILYEIPSSNYFLTNSTKRAIEYIVRKLLDVYEQVLIILDALETYSGGSSEDYKTLNEQITTLNNKLTTLSADTGTAIRNIRNQLGNFITKETDPTVPAWAKQLTKPTYTASEVGALPSDTNLDRFITQVTVTNDDAETIKTWIDEGEYVYNRPEGVLYEGYINSETETIAVRHVYPKEGTILYTYNHNTNKNFLYKVDYITQDGVRYLDATTIFSQPKDVDFMIYGYSSTNAEDAVKIVSCRNYKINTYLLIVIYFEKANTNNEIKLDINNTGAKTVVDSNNNKKILWEAGATLVFSYNGTGYSLVGSVSTSVQSDWNQTDSNAENYIKNKPIFKTINKASIVGSGNMYLTKVISLAGITSDNALAIQDYAQVGEYWYSTTAALVYLVKDNNGSVILETIGDQAYDSIFLYGKKAYLFDDTLVPINEPDWNQTDSSKPDYIKNKPIIPNINNKEDKFNIVNVPSGTNVLRPQVNNCYNIEGYVNNISIILPIITDNTKLQSFILFFTTGFYPNIQITRTDDTPILYVLDYSIKASYTYKVNLVYNGSKWVVTFDVISSVVSSGSSGGSGN